MRTVVTLDDWLVDRAVFLTGLRERGPLQRRALSPVIERESARRRALGRHGAQARGPAPPASDRVILADTSVWIDHLRGGEGG